MDKVIIKDLLVRGIIGINDWERKKLQDILINVTITTDMRKAAETDQIEDCVNYRTISKMIIDLVESKKRFTVEALAADIAELILNEPHSLSTTIRVEKPGAVRFASSVGVEISRSRD